MSGRGQVAQKTTMTTEERAQRNGSKGKRRAIQDHLNIGKLLFKEQNLLEMAPSLKPHWKTGWSKGLEGRSRESGLLSVW